MGKHYDEVKSYESVSPDVTVIGEIENALSKLRESRNKRKKMPFLLWNRDIEIEYAEDEKKIITILKRGYRDNKLNDKLISILNEESNLFPETVEENMVECAEIYQVIGDMDGSLKCISGLDRDNLRPDLLERILIIEYAYYTSTQEYNKIEQVSRQLVNLNQECKEYLKNFLAALIHLGKFELIKKDIFYKIKDPNIIKEFIELIQNNEREYILDKSYLENIAEIAYEFNEREVALKYYDILIKRDPDNNFYLEMLAYLYFSFEKYKEAYEQYRKLHDIRPKDPELIKTCVFLARKTGKNTDADRFYDKLMIINGKSDQNLILEYAEFAETQGEFDKAKELYFKYVKSGGLDRKILERLMTLYLKDRNYEKIFETAKIIDKSNLPRIYDVLKTCEEILKIKDVSGKLKLEIIDFLIDLFGDESDTEGYEFLRGKTYFEMEEYDTAAGIFQKLFETSMSENRSDYIIYRGRCWIEKCNYKLAIRHFEKWLNSERKIVNKTEAMYYLAITYELQKDYKKALTLYEDILLKEYDYRDVNERVEKLQAMVDTDKQAKSKKSHARDGLSDRYDIIEELGEGGMGRVLKAYDKKLEREVAIKIMNPTNDERAEDRMKREARISAKLNHRGIIQIYDVDKFGERLYISMEYCRGKTLRDWIKEQEFPLDRDTILDVFKQICAALDYAHEQNIIHRDIKPENIMMDEKGTVKIMDFGLARVQGDVSVTMPGMIVGSVQYMSPEQINNKPVTSVTDIYALGCIFYELLTGDVLFKGVDITSVMFMHLYKDKDELVKEKFTSMREDLKEAVLKAIDKDASRRYESCIEFYNKIADKL